MILLKTRCGCTKMIAFPYDDREAIDVPLTDITLRIGESVDMSSHTEIRKRRFFNTGNRMEINGEYIPVFLEEW